MNYWYLASAYSHPDPDVREMRFVAACKAAGELMCEGKVVFAPICMTHPIEQHMPEKKEHDFWMKADYPFLIAAHGLIVLMLEGWQTSKGVQEEIMVASRLGKPILYRAP